MRITQTIRRREGDWLLVVEGEVVGHELRETGSWYAHSPIKKLLLDRLRLRRDDGEVVNLPLDAASKVEVLSD